MKRGAQLKLNEDHETPPPAAFEPAFAGRRSFRENIWAGAGAIAIALLSACAPTAAPTNPTVGTAATAAASPIATVVSAAASPAATVVSAAASPAATLAAASPARITAAQISPTDTTLTVQNAGSAAVDLTGWRLRVGSATATLPGNSRVSPGETVTIHTASGASAGRDIYLGADAAALMSGLQPGASIALLDAQGSTVSEFVIPR